MQTNSLFIFLAFLIFLAVVRDFYFKVTLVNFCYNKRVVRFSGFATSVCFSQFATTATQGILGAMRLFFVRVLSNQSITQLITLFKSQRYLDKGKTLY